MITFKKTSDNKLAKLLVNEIIDTDRIYFIGKDYGLKNEQIHKNVIKN